MAVVSKETLKGYFNDGDVPTELEYIDLIDTMGDGDMTKSVYDSNDDGKVNSADSADAAPWTGITGKPATYPATTPVADSNALGGVAASSYLQRTSAARPGVTRLYRDDSDSGYYVRHYWTGTHWYLQGYNSSGSFHAGCRVEYANTVPWTGITGKPSTYTPSAHTHGGGDITSAVASATNADKVDNYHATDLYRDNANFATSGYLDTSSYVDAAGGFRINGVQINGIVIYDAANFLTHSSWDYTSSYGPGLWTMTRTMWGYPSTARYIQVMVVTKGTSATLGYCGANDDAGYAFQVGTTFNNTEPNTRLLGWVPLTSVGGNWYFRIGNASAYVFLKIQGYAF